MQRAVEVAPSIPYRRKSLLWLTGEQGILKPLLFLAPFLVPFCVFLLYPDRLWLLH
ncbi:MAG: hypothetical protein KatS3mg059_0046 [Thermomicrobiales bacterium]|nr:MAG: hypothetical protein KatS3mg059_0046 [Thermomicrobiales bacterium]